MSFSDSYHATVIALLQAREAEPATNIATFLGKQKHLMDELVARWSTNLGDNLPSPDQVFLMLMASPFT